MVKIPIPIIGSVTRFIGSIQSKLDVKKVFVFGSYAKGTYTLDSDIDVCIVANGINNCFNAMLMIADDAVDCDARIEPIVLSEKEFSQEPSFGITREIKQYGIEVENRSR